MTANLIIFVSVKLCLVCGGEIMNTKSELHDNKLELWSSNKPSKIATPSESPPIKLFLYLCFMLIFAYMFVCLW